MTTLDEAVAVLRSGRRDDVMALLTALTPAQRRAFGPALRARLDQDLPPRMPEDAACLAVLATAQGPRQAAVAVTHGWGLTPAGVDDAVRLLATRSPAWLADLVAAIVPDGYGHGWRLARGLVRSGLVAEPTDPDYFRGTLRGVGDLVGDARAPLADRLRSDPGLVRDHVLTMLSTEGVGRLLTSHDAFVEDRSSRDPRRDAFAERTWRVALVTLAREGALERDRLLDVALAAPLRDWAAADLGWFVRLHDALAPSLDEVAERQSTYVRLLTVEHGPSVKMAQRELARLLADRRFEPEPFLLASRATLTRSDKASVVAQLRLLNRLASARPGVRVVDTVRVAGSHPRADVRELATSTLARLGSAPEEAEPEAPSPFGPPAPEPRPPAGPVMPVRSPDELAEVLLGLVEQIDEMEMERAIDGLLRFAGQRPSVTDALVARASNVEYYQGDPRLAAVELTRPWLAPRDSQDADRTFALGHRLGTFGMDDAEPHTFVGAIGRRLTAVARAVRGGSFVPVALPTSSDFRIDAAELDRRLQSVSRSRPALELELVVALLRVPVEQRSQITIPHALRSSDAVAVAREGAAHSWSRLVTAYRPWPDRPDRLSVPIFRDERSNDAHAGAGILARSAPELTAAAEAEYGQYVPLFEQTLRLGAGLMPYDHDTLAAHAHPHLHRDLRHDRACGVPIVDAIARATSAIGPPSASALVLALAAKDARGRIAAQDAIVDLARHGLLDGAEIGRQAALLLTDDVVVGQRVSAGLAECARASDAAVLPVLDALREVVHVLPARRDAGAFLDLTADLAERTGSTVDLPQPFHELAASRSTSVPAKASRRLIR